MSRDLRMWPVATAPICVDGPRQAFQLRHRLLTRHRGEWDLAADWTPVWIGFGTTWRDGDEPLPVGGPRDPVAPAGLARGPGTVPPPARGRAAPAGSRRSAGVRSRHGHHRRLRRHRLHRRQRCPRGGRARSPGGRREPLAAEGIRRGGPLRGRRRRGGGRRGSSRAPTPSSPRCRPAATWLAGWSRCTPSSPEPAPRRGAVYPGRRVQLAAPGGG